MLEAVFLFCANAAAGSDGKLDIHGIFNELYAPDFPARQDRIVLAGIIEWPRDVQGRIPFTIDLVDPQGLSIFTIEGHTDVGVRTAAQAPAKTQVVFPMENVMFPAPGRYRIRVNIDGTEISGPSMHLLRSNTD
jgi:hypothetical protein